jgi:hypothetical protein
MPEPGPASFESWRGFSARAEEAPMNSEPANKLTLEWIKLPDGAVALRFDHRTWKAFEESAKARDISAENMIVTAVVETLSARPATPVANPSQAFFKEADGSASLLFDACTWMVFEETANAREQSPEHMILTAVVGAFGQIQEDNYVLNRFLRR